MIRRIAAFVCLWVVGCGGGSLADVDGTVTFKGESIDRGSIDFVPDGATTGAAGRAAIENGAFKLASPLSPGQYLVRVQWPKKTGKKVKVGDGAPGAVDGMVDETVEAIPAQFNQKSTLKRELKAGKNTLKFEL